MDSILTFSGFINMYNIVEMENAGNDDLQRPSLIAGCTNFK